MKSHSEGNFTDSEKALLRMAEIVVDELPDVDSSGGEVRCHEVARIVAGVVHDVLALGWGDPVSCVLWVQDGLYGLADHSWLWTSSLEVARERMTAPNILDPYCVGQLPQCRLVQCDYAVLPHLGFAYQPREVRTDLRASFIAAEIARICRGRGDEIENIWLQMIAAREELKRRKK